MCTWRRDHTCAQHEHEHEHTCVCVCVTGVVTQVVAIVDELCVVEPTERLGGKWSPEAEAVDPATLKGIEPRTLGHAALRAHPFFAEHAPDESPAHTRPVPTPPQEELALHAVVKRVQAEGITAFGETAEARAAAIAAMTPKVKDALIFECGKRELMGTLDRRPSALTPLSPCRLDALAPCRFDALTPCRFDALTP